MITLPLNGAMNRDQSPIYINSAEGMVMERRNARVVSTGENKSGVNTSIKGTTAFYSPSGDPYTQVGFVEDPQRDSGIWFLRGSGSAQDRVVSVSSKGVVRILLEGNYLNFSRAPQYTRGDYVIDAEILGDFLVWTDDLNPPRKINIVTPPTTQSFLNTQLAVRPPSKAPEFHFGTDTEKKANLLIGKSFQFAYQYIYRDYEYSVLSPYSALAVSPLIFAGTNNTYIYSTEALEGNVIFIKCDSGPREVRSVRVFARENNTGSWFLVGERDRPENVTTEFIPYEFTFANDRARSFLTTPEALSLYSDVPMLAKSVVTAQNRIALSNIQKGYDKTSTVVKYSVEYDDLTTSQGSRAMGVSQEVGSPGELILVIVFPDPLVLNEGDDVTIDISGRMIQWVDGPSYQQPRELGLAYTFTYKFSVSVKAGDTKDDITDAIVADINSKGQSILSDIGVYFGTTMVVGRKGFLGDAALVIEYGWIPTGYASEDPMDSEGSYQIDDLVLKGSITGVPQGTKTYLSGASYNVGLAFYDEFGRTSGVLNGTTVYIPGNSDRELSDVGKAAKIKYTIENFDIPLWAKSARFAVSEATNVLSVFPFVTGTIANKNIIEYYDENQAVIAINIPKNLSYEFNQGDYLVLEREDGGAIETITKTIIGIKSVVEVGTEGYPGYWLIVPKGTESATTYGGKLAHIRRSRALLTEVIYYEDYLTIPVEDGAITAGLRSGYVGDGDAWYVSRTYQWDSAISEVTKIVEDFFVTVDDSLRAYSKGRPIVDLGDFGRVLRKQDFNWSKQLLANTKINGTSFFEALDRKSLDEKHGEISRTILVGDVVKVLQPRKETSIYLGKEQVTNADGTLGLVSTGNFAGTVYPIGDDTGTAFGRAVARDNRNMYYWDGSRGEVFRSSPNGVFPISNYGMTAYFHTLKQALDVATNVSVVFHFDKRYRELYCTFTWKPSGQPNKTETVVFAEEKNEWSRFYDLKRYSSTDEFGVDGYGYIGERNFATTSGVIYELDSSSTHNTFFGVTQPFIIKGTINPSPIQDKVLRSIALDSNKALIFEVETTPTSTRPVGQFTYLPTGAFRSREGMYVSSVNKNIRIANLQNDIDLIYSGDSMVGKSLEFQLRTNDSTPTELKLATFGITVSN
jgi:hypothetical protein